MFFISFQSALSVQRLTAYSYSGSFNNKNWACTDADPASLQINQSIYIFPTDQTITGIEILSSAWWVALITTIFLRGWQSCCHNDNPVINWIMMHPRLQPTLSGRPGPTMSWPIHFGYQRRLDLIFSFSESLILLISHSQPAGVILFFFFASLTNSLFWLSLLLPLALPLIQLLLCLIWLFAALSS